MVEPWLRGTLTEYDAVRRQVLHALELAQEDAEKWCSGLSDAQIHEKPFGLASVAFHLLHIARSLDRLLTYAEGRELTPGQVASLQAELLPVGSVFDILKELTEALTAAQARVAAIHPDSFQQARQVGRKRLNSTVGGLLIHCAEHTQRHIGQVVTTAQIVRKIQT